MGNEPVVRVLQTPCEWCGGPVTYSGHGPMPTYCKQACRQRAYELRTAAARRQADLDSGRIAAVPAQRIIERTAPWPGDVAGWERALAELGEQVRDGRLSATAHARVAYLLRQALTLVDPQPAVDATSPSGPPASTAAGHLQTVAEQLVALGAVVRPVTLQAVASASRLPVGAVRVALAALQEPGRVRLVGAGGVLVDVATVAAHARWRAVVPA